jgi:hypothetical protein
MFVVFFPICLDFFFLSMLAVERRRTAALSDGCGRIDSRSQEFIKVSPLGIIEDAMQSTQLLHSATLRFPFMHDDYQTGTRPASRLFAQVH